LKHSGWGLGLFDFNNDGWKDLFTANSHVNDRVELFEAAIYKEKNTIFANVGGVFHDVSQDSGLSAAKAHRGAAFADFNGDGRIDGVVSSLGEPAELWENISPRQDIGYPEAAWREEQPGWNWSTHSHWESVQRNDHYGRLRFFRARRRALWIG